MNNSIDISIVVPVLNEAENIRLLWQRGNAALKPLQLQVEWIFVNDGSTDRSKDEILKMVQLHPRTYFIDLSRNFGHQIAVTAGLEAAKGSAVVIMDADLQDPPELLPTLWQKLRSGYEVVYARRKIRPGESWFKLWTAKWFYRILAKITSVPIPLDVGDFRIMDRCIVEVLKKMPESHKFIRGQVAWAGFNQTYITYERNERMHGSTGYSWSKMFRFAMDGITAFSDIPLRIVTYFGLIVSIVAFILTLYALYARFIIQEYVPGWASLMVTVLFLGGVQMIAVGIIGEYISRIQSDVRSRPLYVVKETNLNYLDPQKENDSGSKIDDR
jgi:glycosyltransferase involved in cell wall biosynthesis